MTEEGRSRTYTIRSPLVSRTSRYRALLRLEAVERILEREMPDVIESGDPYQVAWKAVASGEALRIPVVGVLPLAFPGGVFPQRGQVLWPDGDGVRDGPEPALRPESLQPVCPDAGAIAGARGAAGGLGRGECREHRPRREHGGLQAGAGRLGGDARGAGHPAGRILLLYVGRLAAEKNTRVLFEAFELLTGAAGAVPSARGRRRGAAGPLQELQDGHGRGDVVSYCADMLRLGAVLPGGGSVCASGRAGDFRAGGAGEPGVRDAGGRHRGQLHGPDHFQFAAGLGARELCPGACAGDPGGGGCESGRDRAGHEPESAGALFVDQCF